MALRDRRVNCADMCGKRILRRYNPSGYCRKCLKKRRLKAIKLKAKQERAIKNERRNKG
jgi:hypothetical protein